MARIISESMSGILEELELESETFVTTRRLRELAGKYSVGTSPALIAHRLKKAGWLITTPQKGVWEFAPASYAGAYSKNDPLTGIKAFQIANPEIPFYLCMQTAAWAHGIADRLPLHTEVAFPTMPSKRLPEQIHAYHFTPNLETVIKKEVPCLACESVLVQMTAKPSGINSWESAMEWLPDLVYEFDIDKLLQELNGRANSVRQRTGYLLQGMYPEAADAIRQTTEVHAKVRFGPRQYARRNDETWKISDTILPISPKDMERVK